jgi:hypothetical protein
MARLAPEDLDGREIARIFMTPKLREARRAEDVLSRRGVDYVVTGERFGRTLLGFSRMGASFYVRAEQADFCAEILHAAGLSRGVVGPDRH